MSTAEFNALLLNNSVSLQPFAVSLTHDQEKAKDLFQETMYKALANRDKYSTGTNIKAWLFTIMRNIFINDYRRNLKARTIFDHSPGESLINSGTTAVINDGITSLQLKEIQQTIHHLPQIFRTPFLLYFEGYRYYEIAESLNEPLGTIKSRIHFARRLMKEQINRN